MLPGGSGHGIGEVRVMGYGELQYRGERFLPHLRLNVEGPDSASLNLLGMDPNSPLSRWAPTSWDAQVMPATQRALQTTMIQVNAVHHGSEVWGLALEETTGG